MMIGLFAPPGTTTGGLFLLIAAAALYTSSRAAAGALAQLQPDKAGWRAVGHVLPIGMVAVVSLLLAQPDVAVGVLFATSVASISLVIGSVLFLSAPQALPPVRRIGLFLLPCALANLLGGLSGQLGWLHCVLLILLGIAIRGVWQEQQSSIEGALEAAAAEQHAVSSDLPTPLARVNWLQLLFAVALALIGAWGASRGIDWVSNKTRVLTGSFLAAGVLGPLLVLPMLGTGADLAQRGHAGSMLMTLLAIPLLNLCLVLPAVGLLGYLTPGVHMYISPPAEPVVATTTRPATGPASQPTFRPRTPAPPATLIEAVKKLARPVHFPITVWRVDTILLVVIGFALLPIAAGRALPGRGEATGLIFAYACYLVAVAWVSNVLARGVAN